MTEKTTEKANIPNAFKLPNVNKLIVKNDEEALLTKGTSGITVYIENNEIQITVHDE